ncbi:iron chelate uptake ABC transporter family permease subunit [Paeniglutamicibacter sp. ZC-3]|uniref:FecCD family ABC transporter permease n=1 Tax=Paeniglutamicibacter sp. ZC-3 TaxID=2986919 RepID=UPI0021F7C3FD|nr:iron chelate uptake ABC transporter family permease subunit [Paeniglutamicibacter sp. ZC-3]MCV9992738.1 iron chelate uptake ABC transporter family permease subunit [Paeniglutamicibacter sp. ZC-3]
MSAGTSGTGTRFASVRALRLGPVSLRTDPRTLAVTALLLPLVLAGAALHIAFGGTPLAFGEVVRALLGDDSNPLVHLAATEFRAPRMAAAVLVGAALAAAGALTQTVARNPLASPDVLGVTSGAAVGAVGVLVLAGGGHAGLSGAAAMLGMPAAAFAAGLLAGGAVYLLAYRRGIDSQRLILVGLGVSGLAASLTTWMLTLGDVTSAGLALTWMMGSLNGKEWTLVAPLAVAAAVLLLAALGMGRWLALSSLGDDVALALGSRIGTVRTVALLLAVLLAAVATVVGGPIAFVALAAPQIARLLCGAALPPVGASALVGALFVLLSDVAAANLLAIPLPVGVATAVLGAPFLMYLILKHQRRTS